MMSFITDEFFAANRANHHQRTDDAFSFCFNCVHCFFFFHSRSPQTQNIFWSELTSMEFSLYHSLTRLLSFIFIGVPIIERHFTALFLLTVKDTRQLNFFKVNYLCQIFFNILLLQKFIICKF